MLNIGTRFVHMAQEAWELEVKRMLQRRCATMLNIPTLRFSLLNSKNEISDHLGRVWSSQGEKDAAAFLADGIGPEDVPVLGWVDKCYAETPIAHEAWRMKRRTDRDND